MGTSIVYGDKTSGAEMTEKDKPSTTKDMLEEAIDIIKGLLDRAPLSTTRAREFLQYQVPPKCSCIGGEWNCCCIPNMRMED